MEEEATAEPVAGDIELEMVESEAQSEPGIKEPPEEKSQEEG